MHQEPQISLPEPAPPQRGPFSFALFVAAAAVIIILLGLYLWPGRQSPSRPDLSIHPPFGEAERAYAPKIQFDGLALGRAENFLKQEVYTVTGEVVNTDARALSELEITVEFFDQVGQVVLRESRLIVSSANPPLSAGERRAFDVSFEHMPSMWNMQSPRVSVTGMRFASASQ